MGIIGPFHSINEMEMRKNADFEKCFIIGITGDGLQDIRVYPQIHTHSFYSYDYICVLKHKLGFNYDIIEQNAKKWKWTLPNAFFWL